MERLHTLPSTEGDVRSETTNGTSSLDGLTSVPAFTSLAIAWSGISIDTTNIVSKVLIRTVLVLRCCIYA